MKNITTTNILNKYIKKIIYLFALFLSNIAFAQNTFGTPDAGDMSVQFIGQIFGGLVGGGSDAFGSSISTFNSVALIVGGILVGYGMLAGTLGTAHDGEMMGKKFSSVWVPIRTTVGTGLVLPVIKGGYCTMQAIVMWLVLQGVSFANSVWTSYASSSALTSAFNPKVSPASSMPISDYINSVYQIQVCLAAANQVNKDLSGTSVKNTSKYTIMPDKLSPKNQERFIAGDDGGFARKNTCGKIYYPIIPEKTEKSAGGSDTAASIDSINSIAKRQLKVDLAPIYKAQMEQAASVVQATAGIAQTAITSTDDGVAAKASLDKLNKSYIDAINAATQSSLSSASKSLVDQAKNEGWFTAGTFATKIILVQGQIASAQSASGSAMYDANTKMFAKNVPDRAKLREYAKNGMGWMKGFSAEDMFVGSAETVGGWISTAYQKTKNFFSHPVQSIKDAWNDVFDFIGEIEPRIIKYFTEVDLSRLSEDTRHPILIAQDMGSSILNMCWGITTVTTIIGTTGGAIPGAGGAAVGALIGFIGTAAAPIAGMWAVGGFLAYALPNLPLLIWFGVIMGWVLMVIQAILAAPLWAIMHVHPSGDDMIGKGNEGYMLVLGLTIRPPLIIFGLIASIVLSNVFGQFLNAIFLGAITTPKSLVEMFNLIFIVVIYAALLTGIIQSTFTLVHKVPDQLLKWIGGGQEQLGGFSQIMESGTFDKVNAVGGLATREVAKFGASAIGVAGGYRRDKMEATAKQNELANKEISLNNENLAYANKLVLDSKSGVADTILSNAQQNSLDGKFDPKSVKVQEQLNKADRSVGLLDRLDNTGNSSQIFRDKFNSSIEKLGFDGALKFATDSALRETSQFKQLSEDSISKLSENGDINSYLNNLGKVENLNNIAGNTIPQDKVMEILNNSLNSNENIADAFKNAESEIDSLVVEAQQINIDDKNSKTGLDIGIGGQEETPR